MSLIFDFSCSWTNNVAKKSWLLTGSRVASFAASLMVFASVIVVGLPDYLVSYFWENLCSQDLEIKKLLKRSNLDGRSKKSLLEVGI